MEQSEAMEQPRQQPASIHNPVADVLPSENPAGTGLSPQRGGGPCSCGGNPNSAELTAYSYVYALGSVEPRFPRLAVEKELAQATRRASAASGSTNGSAAHRHAPDPASQDPARRCRR